MNLTWRCSNTNVIESLSLFLNVSISFDTLWDFEDTVICMLDNNFTVTPWLDPHTPQGSIIFPYLVQMHTFAAYDAFDGYQERLLTGGVCVCV